MDEVKQIQAYKEQVYGYSLGAFIIEVAKAIGEIHPMLPKFEYNVKLSRARSMMLALISVIPEDVYKGQANPLELMDRIEEMGVRELRKTLHWLVSLLDKRKLLIGKKTVRRTTVGLDSLE